MDIGIEGRGRMGIGIERGIVEETETGIGTGNESEKEIGIDEGSWRHAYMLQKCCCFLWYAFLLSSFTR